MATAAASAPLLPPSRQPRRFTVAEYERLGELGLLGPEQRCELIRGVIVEKPVINPPHSYSVGRVNRRLDRLVGAAWEVRSQQPLALADSMPEPDAAVVTGPEGAYANRHPRAAECQLVVEVADSSLYEDQTDKLELYAEAGIPVYWVVNLPGRRVEVYINPAAGPTPSYQQCDHYAPGQDVPVVLAGQPVGALPASELFP